MIKKPANPLLEQVRFYRYWYPEWPECRAWIVAELWRMFYQNAQESETPQN